MTAPADLPLSAEDLAHIAYHNAYLATVRASDPQRASVLTDLLSATYRYDSIAAGDILIDLDYNLYCPQFVTA